MKKTKIICTIGPSKHSKRNTAVNVRGWDECGRIKQGWRTPVRRNEQGFSQAHRHLEQANLEHFSSDKGFSQEDDDQIPSIINENISHSCISSLPS